MIAVRGPAAHRSIRECFEPATALLSEDFPLAAIRYGRWLGPRDHRELRSGEAVVVVATASDAIEVHCHGGRAAVAVILQDLAAVGATTIDADTFQIADRESLTAAESPTAEIAKILAHTSTERTAAIALDQLRGAMGRFAATLRDLLATELGTGELGTGELGTSGALNEAQHRIAEVLRREPLGAHLAEPWKVVLAGPPNVGKSSLLNALLGYRRAITFAAPGTTRDIVSADSAIDGWPVRLSDTAGVRITDAPLEAEGVRRTGTALEGADLVLLVIDSQAGLTTTHREILARTSAPCLFVWNKSDLVHPPLAAGNPVTSDSFMVSATCGTGLAALEAGISRALVPLPPAPGDPVPLAGGQRAALRRAAAATTVAECLAAVELLGDISSAAGH